MVIEFRDPRPGPNQGSFKVEIDVDKVTPEFGKMFDATTQSFFEHWRAYHDSLPTRAVDAGRVVG